MSAQKGSDMLIKAGDGGSPSETFTSLAGLRTKSFDINGETVDITNSDSTNKMRELLAAAGIVSISASGSGVFTNQSSVETIDTRVRARTIDNYQIVIPGFGTYEGPFQVTKLSFAGEYKGELTYDVSLESGGDVAFTAS